MILRGSRATITMTDLEPIAAEPMRQLAESRSGSGEGRPAPARIAITAIERPPAACRQAVLPRRAASQSSSRRGRRRRTLPAPGLEC